MHASFTPRLQTGKIRGKMASSSITRTEPHKTCCPQSNQCHYFWTVVRLVVAMDFFSRVHQTFSALEGMPINNDAMARLSFLCRCKLCRITTLCSYHDSRKPQKQSLNVCVFCVVCVLTCVFVQNCVCIINKKMCLNSICSFLHKKGLLHFKLDLLFNGSFFIKLGSEGPRSFSKGKTVQQIIGKMCHFPTVVMQLVILKQQRQATGSKCHD